MSQFYTGLLILLFALALIGLWRPLLGVNKPEKPQLMRQSGSMKFVQKP
jgi:hypothetical protein